MPVHRRPLGWVFLGMLMGGLLGPLSAQPPETPQAKPPERNALGPPRALPRQAGKKSIDIATAQDPKVTKLIFSPDGQLVASASADQTVGLWDTKTSKRLATLQGNASSDLRFSPDGWMLGAAGPQGSYRLWEVSSGELLVENAPIRNLSTSSKSRFSPELDRLAVGTGEGQVHMIETATGKNLPAIPIFDKQAVGAVAFSGEGKWLAVGSGRARDANPPPNRVVLWDLEQNKRIRELGSPILEDGPARSDFFEHLHFSPEGSLLAGRHSRGGLLLWDAYQGHHWPVVSLQRGIPITFSRDGKTLARFVISQTERAKLELVEVATGGIYRTLDEQKPISLLSLSPDGQVLAGVLSHTPPIHLLDLKEPSIKEPPTRADLKQAVDLLAQKAQQGRKAMAVLVVGNDQSVALLAPFLKLGDIPDQRDEEIQRLIQDLDDDDFFTREKASKELLEWGQAAVPALKAALKKNPPLEVTRRIQELLKRSNRSVKTLSGDALRRIRAIEVLEKIGTDQAREVLKQIAKGPKSSLEIQDARWALKRLEAAKFAR